MREIGGGVAVSAQETRAAGKEEARRLPVAGLLERLRYEQLKMNCAAAMRSTSMFR